MVSAWIATDIIKSVFDILNESPPTDEEEEGFPWMRNFFKESPSAASLFIFDII